MEGPLSEPVARVLVVDDDAAVRTSLVDLFRARRLEVKAYVSAEALLAEFDDSHPACLVLDLRMPGMNGLELLEHLAAKEIDLPTIVITGHGDIPMCASAMRQGAVDFLEKPFHPPQLCDVVGRALQQSVLHYRERQRRRSLKAKLANLTAEEQEVLDNILDGKPNKAVAASLDVSLRTIQFRIADLMSKLGVETRTELIKLVVSHSQAVESPRPTLGARSAVTGA